MKPFEETKDKEKASVTKTSTSSSIITVDQVESTPVDLSNTSSVIKLILEKDKELKRLINEKELLLTRLIHLASTASMDSQAATSSLEAITLATSYRKYPRRDEMSTSSLFRYPTDANNQSNSEECRTARTLDSDSPARRPTDNGTGSFGCARNRSSSKFFQKCLNEDFRSTDQPFARRNSEVPSTITDLDETLKASANDLPEDDEETNSVLIAESDVEEEIEHFNGNPSTEAQTVNLGEFSSPLRDEKTCRKALA